MYIVSPDCTLGSLHFFLSFCIVDGYHDGGSLVGYSVIVKVEIWG